MNTLDALESESIEIIREVYASLDNPVLMYSIGKDSSVLLHLAKKAFYPERIPFPLLHIDTQWKFKEMYDFKEKVRNLYNVEMLTWTNTVWKDKMNPFDYDFELYTRIMKTDALKEALNYYQFDGVIGGGRRDEEKSRAKERVFSFRGKNHKWNPQNQRPEFWNIYNSKINRGESIRIFPISDWTERDIWTYIKREEIDVVPLYFSKGRKITKFNNNLIMVDDERVPDDLKRNSYEKNVRFRTLGCYPMTGAIESEATCVDDILDELDRIKVSERANRVVDDDGGCIEDKKREGYF